MEPGSPGWSAGLPLGRSVSSGPAGSSLPRWHVGGCGVGPPGLAPGLSPLPLHAYEGLEHIATLAFAPICMRGWVPLHTSLCSPYAAS